MRLVQFVGRDGARRVAMADESPTLRVLGGVTRVYDLALEAARTAQSLEALASSRIGNERENYEDVIRDRRLLPPLDHPDPYRCLVTGHGPVPPRQRRGARLHAREAAAGGRVAHRFHEDVQVGHGRRQAAPRH